MKIETMFSCGDSAFVVCGHYGSEIIEMTVGQVRVEVTNSAGVEGEVMFHNYMPQKGYKEEVMCVETGVGSGSIWRAGETIFKTKQDAEAGQRKIRDAYAEAIAAEEKAEEERRLEDIRSPVRVKLGRFVIRGGY